MSIVYIYALETLADWEIGFVTAEINSRRFFKKDAASYEIKFVGNSKNPIKTMGGISITPDCLIEDVVADKENLLLLPGADTWADPIHMGIIEKTKQFLEVGATVAAICGATTAVAKAGILDERAHTSNGAGFLEMFVPEYKGSAHFADAPAVADGNLITGAGSGALLWTKLILQNMQVFDETALEAWYDYFRTGEAQYFFALMQSVSQQ